MIKVNIGGLQEVIGKINLAVEKNSKMNPKSGWIEIKTVSEKYMKLRVSNYDYFVEAYVPIECDDYNEENSIHATVVAETFIPLVSKLDAKVVTFDEVRNCLVLSSEQSEYTFPIIKEDGRVKTVDVIDFEGVPCMDTTLKGKEVVSIAESNAGGLVDATFSRDYQQYIYVDNDGAITFTENIYVNEFENPKEDEPFKFLINATQAKLLKIFDGFEDVKVSVEYSTDETFSSAKKVKIVGGEDSFSPISIVFVVQSDEMTSKFPAIRLRELAKNERMTHAIIDKRLLDKALARLMVFDKKFDKTVLDYSQLEFSEDSVILRSVKNKNFEKIPYTSYQNTVEHKSTIRFADLQNQLKAIKSNTVDVSYGDNKAIILNTEKLKQLIPEIREVEQ